MTPHVATARAGRGSARRCTAPVLLLSLLAGTARAEPAAPAEAAAGSLCLPAIALAEQAERLPPLLLRSIAFIESGRTDPATGQAAPWPWTINAAGTGYFYASKADAIAAAQGFQARGIRSIDVGCVQVNLLHHPAAFPSLDTAFDPQRNAAYAARFLTALRNATGSWPLATAGYHSQTATLGYDYARRVLAIWPGGDRYGALPLLPVPAGRNAAVVRPAGTDGGGMPNLAARLPRMEEDRMQPGPAWVDRTIGRTVDRTIGRTVDRTIDRTLGDRRAAQ